MSSHQDWSSTPGHCPCRRIFKCNRKLIDKAKAQGLSADEIREAAGVKKENKSYRGWFTLLAIALLVAGAAAALQNDDVVFQGKILLRQSMWFIRDQYVHSTHHILTAA